MIVDKLPWNDQLWMYHTGQHNITIAKGSHIGVVVMFLLEMERCYFITAFYQKDDSVLWNNRKHIIMLYVAMLLGFNQLPILREWHWPWFNLERIERLPTKQNPCCGLCGVKTRKIVILLLWWSHRTKNCTASSITNSGPQSCKGFETGCE